MVLAKTEEVVIAPGTLVPIGAVQDIQMPLGGIVEDILVKDGDQVETGQILLKLDTEATTQKLESLKDNLKSKQNQLNLKEEELYTYENLNRSSIATLTQKIAFKEEILDKFKKLADVGASAELQFLQQRNTVKDVEGKLRERELEGRRKLSVYGQEIQRLKAEVSSIKSELAETRVVLRYQVLKSPVKGVVFDLQPKGKGYTGQTSETLMKIVPFDALEAKVEIPSQDIGFVRENMNVDISIDSFPSTDFVVNGIVTRIGSDTSRSHKAETELQISAIISLSEQQLSLQNGRSLTLQPGMSLTANIKLRKVSYLQLLLGSFMTRQIRLSGCNTKVLGQGLQESVHIHNWSLKPLQKTHCVIKWNGVDSPFWVAKLGSDLNPFLF